MPYESMMYMYAMKIVVMPYPNSAEATRGDQIDIHDCSERERGRVSQGLRDHG